MTQMRKSVSESLSPCPVWCLKIWYFNKVCGEEKPLRVRCRIIVHFTPPDLSETLQKP